MGSSVNGINRNCLFLKIFADFNGFQQNSAKISSCRLIPFTVDPINLPLMMSKDDFQAYCLLLQRINHMRVSKQSITNDEEKCHF